MNVPQLIYNLKLGEESAFRELILSFSERLMTVAKVYSTNTQDAEDILQDALISIFQNIKSFNGDEEKLFYGWMKRIVINKALSKKRKKSYQMEKCVDLKDYDHGFDAQILSGLKQEELMKIIFQLPLGYRQVFALFAIEGFSHKEIAVKLNIAPSTSRSQYIRAKRLLKERISRFYKMVV